MAIYTFIICAPKTYGPGMPGSSAPTGPRPNTATTMFPPVLKSEQPSSVILKYMEGIGKRVLKVTDAKL